jgi:hypothetical protein
MKIKTSKHNICVDNLDFSLQKNSLTTDGYSITKNTFKDIQFWYKLILFTRV